MGRRHNGPLWLHFIRLLGAPRAAFFYFRQQVSMFS